MKALELLKNQEIIFVEDNNTSKKVKNLITSFNRLMSAMNDKIDSLEEFLDSQANGELSHKIMAAKSLASFFAGNKHLKVETIVASMQAEEKQRINEYYAIKTQLLEVLHNLIKESSKEAILSSFDVYEEEFQECEVGHEVVILKDRNLAILEALHRQLDESLIVKGTFDSVSEQEATYDDSVLSKNVDLCTRKNNEIYGAKQSKFNKIESVINKLAETGKNVVAFFTHKDTLLDIGCNPKGVKDYEHELTKAYIPLKKALQKEFKLELDDICDVTVNEDMFQAISLETDEEIAEVSKLFDSEPDINSLPNSSAVNSEKKSSETLPHKLESLTNKVSSLIDSEKKKNPFDSDK